MAESFSESIIDTGTSSAKLGRKSDLTLQQVIEAVEADEYIGFCIHCGEEHYGIEPDARRYECEVCGKAGVYGAEELLLMLA
jgi:hypothetical protein